ncbi:hypothetical protein SYNPS1DRAFT_28870 [Syncephalis pseudoplumigaleata]|uniref:DUF4139 domain-containing protein n=1 Tax=Syncephalis pseudoplumigaleata TaxID=1712513 RepID=A0A4P9Z1U6_9FUNG|nr:hypothetical protein SYNPS1DRAFT_28870 [Syncephalis pseudoplumigaleata]|eukprot:RKP25400.1 hypothetical protein SYNPS1DRAFT_28870 [Syncephalis pseudoplumigaleata]
MSTAKQRIRARDHPAREAVVYSDRAEVCRPVRGLSLKPGRNEIEVVGLSSQLSGDTIRVETTSRMVILDVSHHRSKIEPNKNTDDDDDDDDSDNSNDDDGGDDPSHDDAAMAGVEDERQSHRAHARKQRRARLHSLEREKEDLDNELERLTMDYKLLDSYAFMFAGKGRGQHEVPLPSQVEDVNGFRTLMDLYAERSRHLADKTLKCKRQIRDLERRITRERLRCNAAQEHAKTAREWITVKVVLEAEEAINDAEFRLSYGKRVYGGNTERLLTHCLVVHGARWTPRYDVRVSSDRQQLTLHYMAEVVQNTSEAWTAVRMKLSTAMPSLQTTIPDKINPWRVSLRSGHTHAAVRSRAIPPPPPPPAAAAPAMASAAMQTQTLAFMQLQQQQQQSTSLFGSAPSGASTGFGTASFGAAAGATTSADEPSAQNIMDSVEIEGVMVDDEEDDAESITGTAHAAALLNGMMSAFEVNADATVPSDNAPHRVTIAVLDIKATFIHVAFPKISGTHVYLRAFAKNDTDLPLFPGPCNVYVDGSYVTKSSIPRVTVGERFTCPLGADASVSIAYPRRKKKLLTGGFLNRVRMQSFEQHVHLRNGRAKPIFVQVFDQLPVSDEEHRLRVELTEPAKSAVQRVGSAASSLTLAGSGSGSLDHADTMHLPGLCAEEAATTSIEASSSTTTTTTKHDPDGLPTLSTGSRRVRRHPNGLLEWTLRIPPSDAKSIRFAYRVDCAIEDTVHNL